ncbi:hypothetical protein GE061_001448 [Apolygus lucorum]|uniref:Uncharacterized protein n=1 Tax=Apolygus lucorum TaxID=248454 RepID=A0A8S9YEM4_APOLU|nr:hypothetical protein GE061_001448 [Apolygus lucorum]
MDVSVFRTLKEGWKMKVHEWRGKNMENPQLKKHLFAGLLKETLEERVTPSVVSNGFRKCGLFPWNPLTISFDKNTSNPIPTPQPPSTPQSQSSRYQTTLSVIDEVIGSEKVEAFAQSSTWTGNSEDLALYNVWWDIKLKIGEPPNQEVSPTDSQSGVVDIPAIPDVGNSGFNTPHMKVEMDKNENLLPSPFKKVLIWPPTREEMEKPKKRKREQLPSVVTSDQFILYHEQKQQKKRAAEEEKKEKAAARQRKRDEKAEQMRMKKEQREKAKRDRIIQKSRKSSRKKAIPVSHYDSDEEDEQEWVPSGDSCDDVSLNLSIDSEGEGAMGRVET